MAGQSYKFNDQGFPVGRPHLTQCYRIIAENPVAAAEMLHAYMRAFTAVFLGWPMDCDTQKTKDCLFGPIRVAYLKYESSTRGGKHAHGQILQPALQAKQLHKLMSERTAVEYQLHGFMESIMTTFFPIPTRAPTPSTSTDAWRELLPNRSGALVKQNVPSTCIICHHLNLSRNLCSALIVVI
jgi:hypothetical protein